MRKSSESAHVMRFGQRALAMVIAANLAVAACGGDEDSDRTADTATEILATTPEAPEVEYELGPISEQENDLIRTGTVVIDGEPYTLEVGLHDGFYHEVSVGGGWESTGRVPIACEQTVWISGVGVDNEPFTRFALDTARRIEETGMDLEHGATIGMANTQSLDHLENPVLRAASDASTASTFYFRDNDIAATLWINDYSDPNIDKYATPEIISGLVADTQAVVAAAEANCP